VRYYRIITCQSTLPTYPSPSHFYLINLSKVAMQDIYPDVVSPDRLVNEILRGLPCEAALASKAKHLASYSKKSCPSKSTSSSGIGDDLEGTGEDEDMVTSKNASVSSSRAMSIEEADVEDGDAGTNLAQQGYNEVVILDCQNPSEFHECHIRGAINVAFPAILIRRIAAGQSNFCSFCSAQTYKTSIQEVERP